MRLEDHPGYFGLTSQGVVAIHADWPMYPQEHGPDLALLWLTAFPPYTQFKSIDDIDRCNLFLPSTGVANAADPYSERNLHLAIWQEDLLELVRQGFVRGVHAVTERRWEEIKRASLPAELFIKEEDGSLRRFELPPLHVCDDEDASWPEFTDGGIRVTSAGRRHSSSVLADALNDFTRPNARVARLLELGFVDVAVREACVALEGSMKKWLGTEAWGMTLVEAFVSEISKGRRYTNPFMKCLRGEIRMVFKFIRNDVMHNAVDFDEDYGRALLFRVLRIHQQVEHLTREA